jgi:hypothetical protein
MAITGMHALLYTSEPEAVRDLLRDAFGLDHVDAGHGWRIYKLPPAEMGVHPAEGANFQSGIRHEVSFMCDDLDATIADLRTKGVQFDGEPSDQGYGIVITMKLPGGCDVLLYQPRHPTAI